MPLGGFAVALGVLAWLALAGPAAAGFKDGVAAYDAGDYAAAYERWLPLAKQGDAAAQRNLGHLYRRGLGVARDALTAARWYRLAANQGLARAQANLAMMYLAGDGVDQDDQEAVYWLRRAAVQGHAGAQYHLGRMYQAGRGVGRDPARAMGWFYQAARAGHAQARERLGALVLETERAAIDAAAQPAPNPGDDEPGPAEPEPEAEPAAAAPRGRSIFAQIGAWFRDDAPAAATPVVEVAPADAFTTGGADAELAALRRGAEGGDATPQFRLGRALRRRADHWRDLQEAYMWWTLAAEQGHDAALRQLPALGGELTPAQRATARRRAAEWRETE